MDKTKIKSVLLAVAQSWSFYAFFYEWRSKKKEKQNQNQQQQQKKHLKRSPFTGTGLTIDSKGTTIPSEIVKCPKGPISGPKSSFLAHHQLDTTSVKVELNR